MTETEYKERKRVFSLSVSLFFILVELKEKSKEDNRCLKYSNNNIIMTMTITINNAIYYSVITIY